jgi:novobiocin biosynthesis protein NovU/D-mycarose 3-C-methyltransferase
MIYRAHTACRACGSTDLAPVLDLGEQPLANAFGPDPAPRAPLVVLHCPRCTLIQLSVVVDPAVLYAPGYAYVQQSRSPSMKAHFAALIADIRATGAKGSVLEIGSNNGAFLTALARAGFTRRLGVDPAATGGEPAWREPFNVQSAASVTSSAGPYDLVVARHVFAHVDDWPSFIEALGIVTAPGGLVVLEVPDAAAVYNLGDWPYFYHEHLSLVTRLALDALLANTPWRVVNARSYPIHGGCVAWFLRREGEPHPVPAQRLDLPIWQDFALRSAGHIARLREEVHALGGKRVCGYGAPARASVIAAACGFTHADLAFVTDWTPGKAGFNLPGTDIPVVPPERLADSDHAFLFCYTYADEVIQREADYLRRGGHFILPFPFEVRVA